MRTDSFEFTFSSALNDDALKLFFGGEDPRPKPEERAVLYTVKVPIPKPECPWRPITPRNTKYRGRGAKLKRAGLKIIWRDWGRRYREYLIKFDHWASIPPEERFYLRKIYMPRAELRSVETDDGYRVDISPVITPM